MSLLPIVHYNCSPRLSHVILGWLSASLLLLCTGSARAQVLSSFTEPYHEVDLALSEPGTLHQLAVKLGDHVAKESVIAALDTRALEAALKIAQGKAESTAQVDAAQAKLNQIRQRLGNVSEVHELGHASASELQKSKLEEQQARAELQLALEEKQQAALEIERIQAQIESRLARSPISGIVVTLPHKKGEFIASGEPNIATIVQLNRLRAKFYILTSRAVNISKGDWVELELLDGGKARKAQAKVEYIAPLTSAKSGTVHMEVVLDNSDQQHRAGMPCRLVKGTQTHGLVKSNLGRNQDD